MTDAQGFAHERKLTAISTNETSRTPAISPRLATAALLVPCVCWGFGLMMSKEGAEAINRANSCRGQYPFGPIWLLAIRFIIGGMIWLAIFPRSRRGWSWRTVRYGVVLGCLLGISMSVQHLGLVRTSEAVCAFLSALSVLFVPLISIAVFGRRPRWHLWIGIALALVGIYLMTGLRSASFGLGEVLSLVCALCFSVYFLAVDFLVPRDDPFRLTPLMFIVAGLVCSAISLSIGCGVLGRSVGELFGLFGAPGVMRDAILIVLFPTIVAFGSVVIFQPRVDPSRAVIIYLTEPVFAAVVAYIFKHHTLAPLAIAGAALILIANATTELLELRRKRDRQTLSPTATPQPEMA